MSASKKDRVEDVEMAYARILARLLSFPRKIINLETDLSDICEHSPINLKKFQKNWLQKYDLLNFCTTRDEFLDCAETKHNLLNKKDGEYYLTTMGITYVKSVKTGSKKLEDAYDRDLHDRLR